MTINVGEYGIALNLNVNYDLSAAFSMVLGFIRPDGTMFTGTPIAPVTDLQTSDMGIFKAGQYAQYLFQDGDLIIPGTYRVRLTYVDSTKLLRSDITSFDVYP